MHKYIHNKERVREGQRSGKENGREREGGVGERERENKIILYYTRIKN